MISVIVFRSDDEIAVLVISRVPSDRLRRMFMT